MKLPAVVYKEGVGKVELHGSLARARDFGATVWQTFFEEPLTITSTNDGTHAKTSRHYKVPCEAIDLRLPADFRKLMDTLSPAHKKTICSAARALTLLQRGTPAKIRVILEADHVHVQTD